MNLEVGSKFLISINSINICPIQLEGKVTAIEGEIVHIQAKTRDDLYEANCEISELKDTDDSGTSPMP